MTTKEELYERATELEIEGRSNMDKAELEEAVSAADGGSETDGTEVAAPMEDPVGTQVEKRDDEVEETPAEDVEPLSFDDTTTTLNGERASSGDPVVTHENIKQAR